MSDVGIGHDEIVVPQDGLPTALNGSPVNGDELSDQVIIANIQARRLAPVS
jgi:hypothetical protein